MPPKMTQEVTDEWVRIGSTLREFRELRDKNQDELANELGISRPHLTNIEAGRRGVTRQLLVRFAAVLNVRQGSIVRAGYFADVDELVSA